METEKKIWHVPNVGYRLIHKLKYKFFCVFSPLILLLSGSKMHCFGCFYSWFLFLFFFLKIKF